MKEYQQLTAKFKKFKILVIGDFILDAYFKGNCTRLAPEAPVPVVDISEKTFCLGGAANVAANLKALGCEVLFCTVTGHDEHAQKGASLLKKAGISTQYMVQDSERCTLIKTRIITPLQPMLRFDEGTTTDIGQTACAKLLEHIRLAYAECDAVLIADYVKGVLSPSVLNALMNLKAEDAKVFAVDSKRITMFESLKPTLIKPNYEESIKLLSLPFRNANRKEQLKSFGKQLAALCQSNIIAVTLDCEGSLIFQNNELACSSSAPPVVNQHVSGAGDTYISTCLLALLSGASLQQMANMATTAAVTAIEKEHTALCTVQELNAALNPAQKYLSSAAQIKLRLKSYKEQGKRIVFTNGCFDILHSGHVSYLHQAKQMGDILIIGLNTDESIKRLKGESRPVNSLHNRIAVLEALACVDHIIPFGAENDDTPNNLIKLVHPDVFVKGGDYKNSILPETDLLNKIGAEIVFLPYIANQSTTSMIDRMDQKTKLKISLMN